MLIVFMYIFLIRRKIRTHLAPLSPIRFSKQCSRWRFYSSFLSCHPTRNSSCLLEFQTFVILTDQIGDVCDSSFPSSSWILGSILRSGYCWWALISSHKWHQWLDHCRGCASCLIRVLGTSGVNVCSVLESCLVLLFHWINRWLLITSLWQLCVSRLFLWGTSLGPSAKLLQIGCPLRQRAAHFETSHS